MNAKSKYEQHGTEILELYENGKNSSEIAKILGRKYRIKFSKSSIRSFKRFAAKQEKTKNVVPEPKQEQSELFPDKTKEAIEELLLLFEKNYSKQKETAILQEKSLKNLAIMEAKYEEGIEKYSILNETLQETIIQNKDVNAH